jgi:hypothetical protein
MKSVGTYFKVYLHIYILYGEKYLKEIENRKLSNYFVYLSIVSPLKMIKVLLIIRIKYIKIYLVKLMFPSLLVKMYVTYVLIILIRALHKTLVIGNPFAAFSLK